MVKTTKQAVLNEVTKIIYAWAGVASNDPTAGELFELGNALSSYIGRAQNIVGSVEAQDAALSGFYKRKAEELKQKECRGRK